MSKGDKKKVFDKVATCPRCKVNMKETHSQGTFLDDCERCGGVFFDQGEMFAALGTTADPSYWDRPETGGVMREGHLSCPRCKTDMLLQDVKHGADHVEIDRCGECGGIFLDKGEAEKILSIGAKMAETIQKERAAAQAELDQMGDVDFSSPGLIARFL